MLSIQRLVLRDFKSFAGTQEVEFAPGVSVIVGRNASGKSNLVDALRWVFGEDYLPSLRVRSAGELVHRGERDGLDPPGECEVTAILRDAAGQDVPVTRRLEGGGESLLVAGETLDRPAFLQRLRRLGLTAPLATVIRQGDVGRALWLHPRERTELFLEHLRVGPPPLSPASPGPRSEGREQRLRRERSALLASLADQDRPQPANLSPAFRAMLAGLDLPAPAATPPSPERQKEVVAGLLALEEPSWKGATNVGEKRTAALDQVHRRIEDHFRSYLGTLVPGASASLPVVGPSTAGELPGIGLAVTFPRRPTVHVDALSGGQQGTVGLCLALAAFRETPSPALVLDEVEPALDDTLIRRVSALLHEVGAERQVIAVSHQRLMRYTADTVYQLERAPGGSSRVVFRYDPRALRGPSAPPG